MKNNVFVSDLQLMERAVAGLRTNPQTLGLRVSREHYLALADQINWLTNALRIEREFAKEEKGWRCFHCNATFLDPDDARRHFGYGNERPSCLEAAHAHDEAIREVAKMADEVAYWAYQAKWHYAKAYRLGDYDNLPSKTQKDIDRIFENWRTAENVDRRGPAEPAHDIGS